MKGKMKSDIKVNGSGEMKGKGGRKSKCKYLKKISKC